MQKTDKIQNDVKKVDFWPNLHETSCCHGNVKNDGYTIDISKFPRRMNEQLMKVSARKSKSPFKILKKKAYSRDGIHPPSPLYVRGLSDIAKSFAFIELPLP